MKTRELRKDHAYAGDVATSLAEDLAPFVPSLVKFLKVQSNGTNVWFLGRDMDGIFLACQGLFPNARYITGLNREYVYDYKSTRDIVRGFVYGSGVKDGDWMLDTGFEGSIVTKLRTHGMTLRCALMVGAHLPSPYTAYEISMLHDMLGGISGTSMSGETYGVYHRLRQRIVDWEHTMYRKEKVAFQPGKTPHIVRGRSNFTSEEDEELKASEHFMNVFVAAYRAAIVRELQRYPGGLRNGQIGQSSGQAQKGPEVTAAANAHHLVG